MIDVWILARQDDHNWRNSTPPRTARFKGEVNWPSVPREDENFIHCGGWAVEKFHAVFWSMDPEDPPIQFIVEVGGEVLDHLIEKHGFEES